MATSETKEKKRIFRKLKSKYRLVVMNDDSFEVKFSLILSPLNVFTWGGIVAICLVTFTTLFIAFTPVRELIPGYADVNTRKMASVALLRADSLSYELALKNQYLANLKAVLMGQNIDSINNREVNPEKKVVAGINNKPSKEDSILRQRIEAEDQYNLYFAENEQASSSIASLFFFTPLKGVISATYNLKEQHFGVDVIAPKNEAVKATLDGTVILSTWTSETGHVIQLQHENNIVSVYKHNSVLLKKTGDQVTAGEAIAIIGESGELSTGPHLHFELWHKGAPVDPQDYIIF